MGRINSSTSRFVNACGALALLFCLATTSQAQPAGNRTTGRTPEERAARYFESLRKLPPQMLAFLLKMPKGGDLHNHLSGAIYAESFVQWAADKGLCVSQTTLILSPPPCDQSKGQVAASAALSDTVLY